MNKLDLRFSSETKQNNAAFLSVPNECVAAGGSIGALLGSRFAVGCGPAAQPLVDAGSSAARGGKIGENDAW